MITYSVKKNKRSRMTFRLLGLFLMAFTLLLVVPVILGFDKHSMFSIILSVLVGMYGLVLVIHSFGKTQYDIVYEFHEDEIVVKHHRGESFYKYEDIVDYSLISPDNANIYSIINIKFKNEAFLIPFSFKKEFCDKVYNYLNERVTSKMLENGQDIE
ncbi:MAG: hypothetical protein K6C35_08700 [Eubacterium sp.]|nr:hypothetical protein [Eubacterium sp.]SEF77114.1 hypothetical protein SAMN04487934_10372 [Eubacterium ruminantium]